MSSETRVVEYSTPRLFFLACLPYDTWHMNVALGSAVEAFAGSEAKPDPAAPGEGVWLAVRTGKQLDLTLTPHGQQTILSAPAHSAFLSSDWLAPRVQLLGETLHQLVSQGEQVPVKFLRGPVPLVQAFATAYGAFSGIQPQQPALTEQVYSHIPRSRIDCPLARTQLPEGHTIRCVVPGDTQALVELTRLIREFREGINGPDSEEARGTAQAAEEGLKWEEYWVYVVVGADGEEYAGYVRHGRLTGRCAAIRNVYTVPAWRGKGVARILVGEVVRRLFSGPHGMKEVLSTLLSDGAKCQVEDVCIFTETRNGKAQSVYRAVGFGFPGAAWEGEDGTSWEEFVELEYPVSEY